MPLRFTNGVLLALLIGLTLTGLWGLVFTLHGRAFELHRIAGWALLTLAPAKLLIAARSLRRGPSRRFDRSVMLGVSLVLGALGAAVLALALAWAWQLGPSRLALDAGTGTAGASGAARVAALAATPHRRLHRAPERA